jgi:Trypsin-like peptidase domain
MIEDVLRGRIEHIAYVIGQRDSLYAGLARRFNALAGRKLIIPATAFETFTTSLRRAVWVVETDLGKFPPDHIPSDHELMQGTAFYLAEVGWVTCCHCVETNRVDHSAIRVLFRPDSPSKRYPFRVTRSHAAVDLAVLSADIPTAEYEPLHIRRGASPQYHDLIQNCGLAGIPTRRRDYRHGQPHYWIHDGFRHTADAGFGKHSPRQQWRPWS